MKGHIVEGDDGENNSEIAYKGQLISLSLRVWSDLGNKPMMFGAKRNIFSLGYVP